MSDRIISVHKETEHRFLNFYTMLVRHRDGGESDYFMTSRAEKVEGLKAISHGDQPDGVGIYAVCGQNKDHVVLVRQYRYPLGGYIYELPAGLVEKGEKVEEAAVREFYEETGMKLTPVHAPEMFTKPRYMTIGLTDECCSTVYGYAEGKPDNSHQEATEDIQIVVADAKEVKRILEEENVAIMCAYQLMHFLQHIGDPFYFIEENV